MCRCVVQKNIDDSGRFMVNFFPADGFNCVPFSVGFPQKFRMAHGGTFYVGKMRHDFILRLVKMNLLHPFVQGIAYSI